MPLYIAGGFLRDYFSGNQSSKSDIDLASEITPKEIELLSDVQVYMRGSQFGSCIVSTGSNAYDHTILRAESYEATSRLPDIVNGDIYTDLYRRDSTINSALYDIKEGILYTHPKFFSDVDKSIIRSTSNPFITRFEDPLRIIRDFIFASDYLCDIHWLTLLADKFLAKHIQDKVPKERLTAEISKIRYINMFICKLKKTGIYNKVFSFDMRSPFVYKPYRDGLLFWAELCKGNLDLLRSNFTLSKKILKGVSELYRYEDKISFLRSSTTEDNYLHKQYLLRCLRDDLS